MSNNTLKKYISVLTIVIIEHALFSAAWFTSTKAHAQNKEDSSLKEKAKLKMLWEIILQVRFLTDS